LLLIKAKAKGSLVAIVAGTKNRTSNRASQQNNLKDRQAKL
jgi:hypothetical protein